MKIKNVMLKPVFLNPSDNKKKIFSILKKHPNTDLFIVVDKNKKFLGDITINELFLMFLPNDNFDDIGLDLALDLEKRFFAKNAKELMRKHDFSCNPDDNIISVALQLAGLEINEMPVIDKKERVVGYITERLLVRYLEV